MGGTRSYTNEQIQFVLDAWIDGKKAPEIVQAYRQAFGDQRFGVSQVKYLKSAYGEDAEFGVPLVNRVMRPSVTDCAAPSARTLAGASLSQRGYGRPPTMRPFPSGADSNKLPTSAQQHHDQKQQPAGFPARLASEPAPMSMPRFNYNNVPFSGGPVAPGAPAATRTGTPVGGGVGGGTLVVGGPRSIPLGAGPLNSHPPPQGAASLVRDVMMNDRPMTDPGDAFWSGLIQGPSSLDQKSAVDMRCATAPIGGTPPDAATQPTTTPAFDGFLNSPTGTAAKTAAPSTSALAIRAGSTALAAPATGWYYSTSHDGCPIQAKHRHDPNGGIHFDGMCDLRHAMVSHLCTKLEEISRAERAQVAEGGGRDVQGQQPEPEPEPEPGQEQEQEPGQTARSGAPEPSSPTLSLAGDEHESTAMEQC